MTESVYPPSTPAIGRRRRELAPEIHEAFQTFSRSVFSAGSLPEKTKPALGLTGEEIYSITGLEGGDSVPDEVTVQVESEGQVREITTVVRIDTPAEEAYYRHGGILQFVLRQLLAGSER